MIFCIVWLSYGRKAPGSIEWLVAWIHAYGHAFLHTSLIYAYMYTTVTIYKTPHLAQTDQARPRRFFFALTPTDP